MVVRHALRQRRVVAALMGTALRSMLRRLGLRRVGPSALPGPERRARVPPLPPALVRDYAAHVGGAWDPGQIPAHLFPQWSFPLAARVLAPLPYPLLAIVNAGCRLELNAPLPAGVPLEVSARLEGIDDDGQRAVLRQRIVTGTAARADAVVAHVQAVVPSGPRPADRPRREPVLVPADAQLLARWQLGAGAGLAYAFLTGDFNPVHWLRPYARAFGFAGVILQGFATLARATEGLARAVGPVKVIDVRFTRPLVLPAEVGLHLHGSAVYVADAPGAPAYLAGTVTF